MPQTFLPHVPTLALATVFVAMILGSLLLFTWLQDRSHRALLWWGPGFLLGGAGTALLALRGVAPDFLTMDIANAAVIMAAGCMWIGMRTFEGRAPRAWGPLAVALAWIIASQMSFFATDLKLRVTVASLTLSSLFLLSAFELWRGRAQPLMSRWPAIVVLCVYGSFMLGRLFIVQFVELPPAALLFQSKWFGLMSLSTLLFVTTSAFLLLALTKERTELHHRRAALTDPLTGLLNRRAFLARADGVLTDLESSRRPVSVLVFDLDHFKQINDRFGHPMGDCILQTFSEVAHREVRKNDLVGRIGGEEFAAVLPDCDQEHAAQVGERIRRAFAVRAAVVGPRAVEATVSVGFATAPGGSDLPALLADADGAVYRAKAAGRNCVRGPERPAAPALRTVPSGSGDPLAA
ncbi:MAG: GGDEF domain-containing protein [Variibacter sp.]|nr:GGDEF domain-containing protein [Variibacter sp.]